MYESRFRCQNSNSYGDDVLTLLLRLQIIHLKGTL